MVDREPRRGPGSARPGSSGGGGHRGPRGAAGRAGRGDQPGRDAWQGGTRPATAAPLDQAAFGSFRWGELAALRRCDVEVKHGTVRGVARSLTELAGGGYLFGPPKSAAGKRVVVIPAVIRPLLARHLDTFAASEPDALVFTSPTGRPLRDGNFRRRVWRPALAEAGLADVHFHDLRHAGGTQTRARAMIRRNERRSVRLTWDAGWWGYQDLNLGPLPYQGSALTV